MWGRNYSLTLLLKSPNWAYLWIPHFIQFVLLYGELGTFEIYWNQAADHLLLPHINLFFFLKKKKRSLELVSLPYFLHDYLRKIFILLYSINWPNSIIWLPLLRQILSNMCIVIVCAAGCDVNLIFLIKPFILHDQKVKTKI